MCRDGLRGVGDASLGEWLQDGIKDGVVHLLRRLGAAEQIEFAVPQPVDIRGTDEEHERIASVYSEAPHLHTHRKDCWCNPEVIQVAPHGMQETGS